MSQCCEICDYLATDYEFSVYNLWLWMYGITCWLWNPTDIVLLPYLSLWSLISCDKVTHISNYQ